MPRCKQNNAGFMMRSSRNAAGFGLINISWKSELAETGFGMTVIEDKETIPVNDQSQSSTEQGVPQ